jgi:uncharacterized membrane protein YebE (DUF533 family)
MTPNRVVALALAVCGIAAAVLPVAATMDWTSTRGVLGGRAAVTAAAVTWLLGWQKYEGRALLQLPQSAAAALPNQSGAEDDAEHDLGASTIVAAPHEGEIPKDRGNARAVRKTEV